MTNDMSINIQENGCAWEGDGDGVWETDCGQTFQITEGLPSENDMRYCCYCGKSLEEHPYQEG